MKTWLLSWKVVSKAQITCMKSLQAFICNYVYVGVSSENLNLWLTNFIEFILSNSQSKIFNLRIYKEHTKLVSRHNFTWHEFLTNHSVSTRNIFWYYLFKIFFYYKIVFSNMFLCCDIFTFVSIPETWSLRQACSICMQAASSQASQTPSFKRKTVARPKTGSESRNRSVWWCTPSALPHLSSNPTPSQTEFWPRAGSWSDSFSFVNSARLPRVCFY